jgi:hypothetical protein
MFAIKIKQVKKLYVVVIIRPGITIISQSLWLNRNKHCPNMFNQIYHEQHYSILLHVDTEIHLPVKLNYKH